MSHINLSAPVLVTGASGYLASWVVKHLLDEGRTVHATVRDKKRNDKVGHLQNLATGSDGKLILFEADLLEDGSFDEAMRNCELVIHTASPFKIGKIKNPQAELVDPAVNGTRTVLESANRTPSVKRIVLTASVVSMYGDAIEIRNTPGGVFTEEMWNTTSSLDHLPYPYSKTVAERTAWDMAEAQDRWDLVTVHPAFVLGPSLSARMDGASNDFMKGMIKGEYKMGIPDLHFGVVDVRDVSKVHVLAGYNEKAHGRYIACATSKSALEIADIIRDYAPDKYPLPKSTLPKILLYLAGPFQGFGWKQTSRSVGIPIAFDNSRALKELGIKYRPAEETVKEHIGHFENNGLV